MISRSYIEPFITGIPPPQRDSDMFWGSKGIQTVKQLPASNFPLVPFVERCSFFIRLNSLFLSLLSKFQKL
jgi:hypothetical protein